MFIQIKKKSKMSGPFVIVVYIFVLPNRTLCRFEIVENQTSNLAKELRGYQQQCVMRNTVMY